MQLYKINWEHEAFCKFHADQLRVLYSHKKNSACNHAN